MLPQQPVIRLLPRKTGAVDAALLTGADAGLDSRRNEITPRP